MESKKSLGETLKAIGLKILKSIQWRPIVKEAYFSAIKPELMDLVKDTESKWDDLAVSAVDYVVITFLGEPDEKEEKKAEITAALSSAPVSGAV